MEERTKEDVNTTRQENTGTLNIMWSDDVNPISLENNDLKEDQTHLDVMKDLERAFIEKKEVFMETFKENLSRQLFLFCVDVLEWKKLSTEPKDPLLIFQQARDIYTSYISFVRLHNEIEFPHANVSQVALALAKKNLGIDLFDKLYEFALLKFIREHLTQDQLLLSKIGLEHIKGKLDAIIQTEKAKELIPTESDKDKQIPKTINLVDEVLDIYVQDLEANVVPFSELIRNKTSVVILLCHWGCPAVFKIIDEMNQLRPVLKNLNVSLYYIGCGTYEKSCQFLNDNNEKLKKEEIFQDSSLALFRKMECGVMGKTVGLQFKKKHLKGYQKLGYKFSTSFTGDPFQMGGTWVIKHDAVSKENNSYTVLYQHIEKFRGDHFPISDLLTACGATPEVLSTITLIRPSGIPQTPWEPFPPLVKDKIDKKEVQQDNKVTTVAKSLRRKSMGAISKNIITKATQTTSGPLATNGSQTEYPPETIPLSEELVLPKAKQHKGTFNSNSFKNWRKSVSGLEGLDQWEDSFKGNVGGSKEDMEELKNRRASFSFKKKISLGISTLNEMDKSTNEVNQNDKEILREREAEEPSGREIATKDDVKHKRKTEEKLKLKSSSKHSKGNSDNEEKDHHTQKKLGIKQRTSSTILFKSKKSSEHSSNNPSPPPLSKAHSKTHQVERKAESEVVEKKGIRKTKSQKVLLGKIKSTSSLKK